MDKIISENFLFLSTYQFISIIWKVISGNIEGLKRLNMAGLQLI